MFNMLNLQTVMKKNYNQPAVQVTLLKSMPVMQAGSPAAVIDDSGAGKVNMGIPTDEVW